MSSRGVPKFVVEVRRNEKLVSFKTARSKFQAELYSKKLKNRYGGEKYSVGIVPYVPGPTFTLYQ